MTLREWMSAKWRRETPASERISIAPKPRPRPQVRDGYLPLYTYLEHRYASSVVLTFEQMEALLGFALPQDARLEPDWWTTAVAVHGAADGNAWTVANRTATPNLPARNVRFERLP
jgi:hypothetical protein